MTHPYSAFEGSQTWRLLDDEVASLEHNGDLKLTTAREYVIGSLCQRLEASGSERGAANPQDNGSADHPLERALNPVFLQARKRLEGILANARFTIAHDFNSPQSFGSAYTEYSGGHKRVKLVWDGKEGFLILLGARTTNHAQQPRDWESLVTEESPLQLKEGPPAEAWIATLAAGLRRFLTPAV